MHLNMPTFFSVVWHWANNDCMLAVVQNAVEITGVDVPQFNQLWIDCKVRSPSPSLLVDMGNLGVTFYCAVTR